MEEYETREGLERHEMVCRAVFGLSVRGCGEGEVDFLKLDKVLMG